MVIYGAGNIGKLLVELLTNGAKKADILCIAVSISEYEEQYYYGIEICSIDKIKFDKNTKIILATVKEEYKKQMRGKCKEIGVLDENIICLDDIITYECC